jgi:hypothetical protein
MDTTDSSTNVFDLVIPAPPRLPSFVPHSVSVAAPRRALVLVASNPTPAQTRATVPALRLIRTIATLPSTPPSMPPTGSTPIRHAA